MPGNTQDIPLTKSGKPDKRYKPKNNIPKNLTVSDLPKIEQFIYYQYQGYPNKQAALAAGYAQTTATHAINRIMETNQYQEKCVEYSRIHNVQLLPIAGQIHSKIMNMINNNPDLYPKFKDVPRQIQQRAGVLQDSAPVQATVTIQVQANIGVMVGQDIGLDVIDVTPEDVNDATPKS